MIFPHGCFPHLILEMSQTASEGIDPISIKQDRFNTGTTPYDAVKREVCAFTTISPYFASYDSYDGLHNHTFQFSRHFLYIVHQNV